MLYDRTVYLVKWAIALIFVVIAGIAIVGIAQAAEQKDILGGLLGLTIAVFPAVALAVRFRVMADGQAVRIHWGLFEWPKCVFRLDTIEACRIVRFRPLTDFGGWGWRRGRDGTRCYNLRGNTGVELRIAGTRYIIGVPDAQRLVEAIQMSTSLKPEPGGEWAPEQR